MNAPVKQNVPALAGGGHVMAIVPQTFEETFRVAKAVYLGGLAPAALIGKLDGDAAISAVTVAIMSGAELGLKPMVALRSFTVINGKPALYGDGLINVVRQSGKVAYLRTGYAKDDKKLLRDAGVLPSLEDEEREPGITERVFARLSEDERTFGYCAAKRSDTGEEKTVVFTVFDAIRAGLWQTEAIVTKWNKWDKKNEQKPNDSPWWRFPQRMLAWRAAGYCLRELFGDVLGGIRDEFEAREIAEADDMRDITPRDRPTPPKPPTPPEPPVEDAEVTDVTDESSEQPTGDGEQEGQTDSAEFFTELEEALAGAMDEATIEEIWTGLDPEGTFDGDDVNLDIAHKIKQRRLGQINPMNGG
ncbi:recombinase RecT [Rhizobium mongolense]|uniref:recombinase RecT n=1 Tax=Rhizobium mongolense TaxID=57676 RepID=UPI0034A40462